MRTTRVFLLIVVAGFSLLLMGCRDNSTQAVRFIEPVIFTPSTPAVEGIERPVRTDDSIQIGLSPHGTLDLDWGILGEAPLYAQRYDLPEPQVAVFHETISPFTTPPPHGIYTIPIIFPTRPVFPDTLSSYTGYIVDNYGAAAYGDEGDDDEFP
jgi:hypothetical protein